MTTLSLGWDLDVTQGEGWLIIRPRPHGPQTTELVPLSDEILKLLEWCWVNRVILVLDGLDLLTSFVVGQLIKLHRHLENNGGILRLCGVNSRHRQVLERLGMAECLPIYDDVRDAVMGGFPCKPR
jgi:anti-anti-sigma factor